MNHAQEFAGLIEQDAEGCYIAEPAELRRCYTQACSPDELMDRRREALLDCPEDQRPDGV